MEKSLTIIMIIFLTFLFGNFFLNCSTQIKQNSIIENDEKKDKKNNENNNVDGTLNEEYPGNSISGINDPEKYIGEYIANISNFKAIITIDIRNNKFYGEIKFDQWGNGLPQPLKDLNIADNKIYFIRSVTSEQELKKYSSNRFFKQRYHGIFSKDQKKIKGYFIDAGAEASWVADKK